MCMDSNTTNVQPSRDSLGKIAWVRYDFLSHDKISENPYPCARMQCVIVVFPGYTHFYHKSLTLFFLSFLVHVYLLDILLFTRGKEGHSAAAQNCFGESYRYYSAYSVCVYA